MTMKTLFTWNKTAVAALALCAVFACSGCGGAASVESEISASALQAEASFGVESMEETEGTASGEIIETPDVIQTTEIPGSQEAQPEESAESPEAEETAESPETDAAESPEGEEPAETEAPARQEPQEEIVTVANVTASGVIDATELFSDRDLTQTVNLSGAETCALADGEDIHITQEGVYVLSGAAADVTVYVEADSEAKVQLVLDGASITNEDFPCIYVLSADKVFVTTTETENSLSVTGTFVADGDTNTDGVIFSREDLVLGGLGTLTISSTNNGVVTKDDLKVTGGAYVIDAASKCFEANDSIRIAAGTFDLTAGTDGFHAENEEDDSQGWIYICGGDFTLNVGDDGIHAVSALQIDGGTFAISAAEGLEGTYIQINGGSITIDSWDDGINGAYKSTAYPTTVEITGGELTVTMASGDTDGIDSNGDLIITGGTVNVSGQSTFDCDGTVTFTGGTVYVNGAQVDSIPTQMMGRGGRGGW